MCNIINNTSLSAFPPTTLCLPKWNLILIFRVSKNGVYCLFLRIRLGELVSISGFIHYIYADEKERQVIWEIIFNIDLKILSVIIKKEQLNYPLKLCPSCLDDNKT
ncbi:hypothetical protein K501DRAFT_265855 [Backusella circina FSU 941]|nr:hypothetical protein K501DRAFT_265855 [Backusella circina FSU 941]